MKKILFVCAGNTCRSPMAEAVAKNIIKEKDIKNIRVSSAGISANPMQHVSVNAKKALKLAGINFVHKARLLNEAMIRQNDIVLTMTAEQKAAYCKFPNVFSVKEFTGLNDILDPYGKDLKVYIETLNEIKKAVNIVIEKIEKQNSY